MTHPLDTPLGRILDVITTTTIRDADYHETHPDGSLTRGMKNGVVNQNCPAGFNPDNFGWYENWHDAKATVDRWNAREDEEEQSNA